MVPWSGGGWRTDMVCSQVLLSLSDGHPRGARSFVPGAGEPYAGSRGSTWALGPLMERQSSLLRASGAAWRGRDGEAPGTDLPTPEHTPPATPVQLTGWPPSESHTSV